MADRDVLAVAAEVRDRHPPHPRQAVGLGAVGHAADAARAVAVGAGEGGVRLVEIDEQRVGRPVAPRPGQVEVGQGQRGDGRVAQFAELLRGQAQGAGQFGRSPQDGQALEPLPGAAAHPDGPRLVLEGREVPLVRDPLAVPGLRLCGVRIPQGHLLPRLFRRGVGAGVGRLNQAPRRAREAYQQGEYHHARRQHRAAVPPGELAEPVTHRRRARQDRLVRQVSPDVGRQGARRLVPPVPVLIQRLHHDPVGFAADRLGQVLRVAPAVGRHRRGLRAKRAQPRTRPGRLLLPDDPPHLVVPDRLEPLLVERGRAGQQFVEEYAERVDVRASVHVEVTHPGLLGRHVQRRTDHLRDAGEQRLLRQHLPQRLGHAEVDHLDDRGRVVPRDQDVTRLDVAVDDPLLVGVLDGRAHLEEQFQPPPRGQVILVAERGHGRAPDQLHHEVRAAGGCRPAVEHPGDVGVVHEGQRLPLGLEPRDHLPRVHARLEHLQRDLAPHGPRLLGQEHYPEPAVADLFQQLVRPDDRPGALRDRLVRGRPLDRLTQEAVRRVVRLEKGRDLVAELTVRPAGLFEEGFPLTGG